MKRVLIRIMALATVVLLGLIAVTQAQRSVGDPAPKADASEVSPPASPARPAAPKTNGLRTDRLAEPGLFPGSAAANPLRQDLGRPSQADAIAAWGESGLSGGSASSQPLAAVHAESTALPEGTGPGPRDPFALMAAAGNSATDQNREIQQQPRAQRQQAAQRELPLQQQPQVQRAEEPLESGSGPKQPPRAADLPTDPPDTAGRSDLAGNTGRYPRLLGPGQSDLAADSQLPTATAEPNAEQPLVGNRYGNSRHGKQPAPPADSREPARLELDPSVPVSSLPNSTGVRGGAAAPGLAAPRSPVSAVEAGLSPQGTGTPGSRQFEGPQRPQVTIEKIAPAEIQVGREATFQVKVVNGGQVAAQGVEVRDEIPRGTRLLDTNPPSSRDAQGRLVWSLGTMQPGDEITVEMRVMPELEGEIGSVATVSFNAEASARTVATKPELVVKTSAPSQVRIGGSLTMTITVSNPGSGVASNVVLEEHVPPGFQHPAGEELEYVVGDLKPGESRQLELTLTARSPGVATNVLSARAEPNLKVDEQLEIEIVAPQLDLAVEGPRRRYLEREATYTVSIRNPGTAPAQNVELVAHLPEGMEFVAANNSGQYEPTTRTVHWLLEELPVQETGTVRLTTLPVAAGEQTLRYTCTGEPGLSVEGEQPVLVEGIAAILFQVVDVQDPIELGGETVYEIRVMNQGSKAATNVQLVATVPAGMRAIAAEGPVRYGIDANRVIFEGLPRLAPKADATYRVRVQGLQPGDLRLSVQLLADEMSAPVTKEESTRVYSDE